MMKKFAYINLLILLMVTKASADEGMWLPIDVKNAIYLDMKELGLELTPDQIYSVNQASLTDAIVSLGGFCTGEMVSAQGLMLTNHHCADGAIQSHSSVENDLLENGFWAKTREEELPNEGLFVRFLVRMEDVSEQVLADVTEEMPEEDRNKAVDAAIQQIKRNTEP
ncbi:MAG: S46 family peptidase, partial [Cyclobacteriaceae bacterium]